jgi:hypothetical protein
MFVKSLWNAAAAVATLAYVTSASPTPVKMGNAIEHAAGLVDSALSNSERIALGLPLKHPKRLYDASRTKGEFGVLACVYTYTALATVPLRSLIDSSIAMALLTLQRTRLDDLPSPRTRISQSPLGRPAPVPVGNVLLARGTSPSMKVLFSTPTIQLRQLRSSSATSSLKSCLGLRLRLTTL